MADWKRVRGRLFQVRPTVELLKAGWDRSDFVVRIGIWKGARLPEDVQADWLEWVGENGFGARIERVPEGFALCLVKRKKEEGNIVTHVNVEDGDQEQAELDCGAGGALPALEGKDRGA